MGLGEILRKIFEAIINFFKRDDTDSDTYNTKTENKKNRRKKSKQKRLRRKEKGTIGRIIREMRKIRRDINNLAALKKINLNQNTNKIVSNIQVIQRQLKILKKDKNMVGSEAAEHRPEWTLIRRKLEKLKVEADGDDEKETAIIKSIADKKVNSIKRVAKRIEKNFLNLVLDAKREKEL